MGMTIDDTILCLKGIKNYGRDTFTEQSDWQNSLDTAIDTMCKYQHITKIVEAWEADVDIDSYDCMSDIREVIEDGNNSD